MPDHRIRNHPHRLPYPGQRHHHRPQHRLHHIDPDPAPVRPSTPRTTSSSDQSTNSANAAPQQCIWSANTARCPTTAPPFPPTANPGRETPSPFFPLTRPDPPPPRHPDRRRTNASSPPPPSAACPIRPHHHHPMLSNANRVATNDHPTSTGSNRSSACTQANRPARLPGQRLTRPSRQYPRQYRQPHTT